MRWLVIILLFCLCAPAKNTYNYDETYQVYKPSHVRQTWRAIFGVLAVGAGLTSYYYAQSAQKWADRQVALQVKYDQGFINTDFEKIKTDFEAAGQSVEDHKQLSMIWGGVGIASGLGFSMTFVRF